MRKTGELRLNEVRKWKNERFFTKWLKENIYFVENIIHKKIEKENVFTEVKESEKNGKGKYPVDILAIADNGEKIIIENQYFKTDHVHIGEIMTYAAWHDASTVVWIAEDVDKEHLEAVEYLNKLSEGKNFKFWLLLAKPIVENVDDENPKIELREATKNDIQEKNHVKFRPKNTEINIAFWDEFEKSFPFEGFKSFHRFERSDCIELRWGESYYLNVPFRSTRIKFEVKFTQEKNIYYENLLENENYIRDQLELEKYDTFEICESPVQIRVTIPAQVTNQEMWKEYIAKMTNIILRLRDIVDDFKNCF